MVEAEAVAATEYAVLYRRGDRGAVGWIPVETATDDAAAVLAPARVVVGLVADDGAQTQLRRQVGEQRATRGLGCPRTALRRAAIELAARVGQPPAEEAAPARIGETHPQCVDVLVAEPLAARTDPA
ncbi:hypothetical protein RZS08_13700, partial [Arthrospira platensis SPKY1]|nr:hypothetical protein [Arthrospira platensis SPKY1]